MGCDFDSSGEIWDLSPEIDDQKVTGISNL
jgi:hypothetical protein